MTSCRGELFTAAAGFWVRSILCAAGFVLCAASSPAQTPAASAGRFVVVLDAAHGGSDAGAPLSGESGHAEPEKDYALAFTVRLRSLLAARGIAVIATRESDAPLSPQQRAEIANRANAQACLTLHASMSGSGVHLFISSLAPAAKPALLQPQNEELSPERRLTPWKTAQATAVERSVALAGTLNSALLHAGVPVTLGRTALTTIDSMTCPAVAVEVAPEAAGNDADGSSGHAAAAIDDPGYEAQIAEALAAGLLEWRAEGQQP